MSEEIIRNNHTENLEKMLNIRNITPIGEEPLLYWYNVARDAITAQQRSDERRKEDRAELERLKKYEQDEQNRRMYDLSHKTIPDFRDLLNRVQNGDFSMNVQFSFYPNCDRKEGADDAEE